MGSPELRTKWNVKFYPDIATMCKNVDAILLESGDGRVHLAQVKPLLARISQCSIDNRWLPRCLTRARLHDLLGAGYTVV